MCGGSIVVHPCSQVAHVFKGFAYSFDGDRDEIIALNMLRVAEMWLDDYSKYVYAVTHSFSYKHLELTDKEIESIKMRKSFRKENDCENFDWFLRNIIPEMSVPDIRTVTHFGEVYSRRSEYCWQVEDDGYITMTLDCYVFSRIKYESEFTLTKTGHLMYQEKCVRVEDNHLLRAVQCNESDDTDLWSQGWSIIPLSNNAGGIEPNVGRLNFVYPVDQSIRCIQQVTNILKIHQDQQMPQLAECDTANTWQVWSFTYNFDSTNIPRNVLKQPNLSVRGPPI